MQYNAVEVVKGFLDALGQGDMQKAVASFTDDGSIQMPGSTEMPWAGIWRGKKAIEDYYQVMPKALDIRGATQTRWVSQGNVVVVTGTEHAASRVSGKEYKGTWCWVLVVRDGKIESLESYEDTEAMRACAPWRNRIYLQALNRELFRASGFFLGIVLMPKAFRPPNSSKGGMPMPGTAAD